MVGLQPPSVDFLVHRREVHQQMLHAGLDQPAHEGGGEVGRVGVGPSPGAFVVPIGCGSDGQRLAPWTSGLVKQTHVEHVVACDFFWRQGHQGAWHQRWQISEALVHAVDVLGDVAKALCVRAMSMGVEGDVPEVHRAPFGDGAHKTLSTDGDHLGVVHVPR